MVGSPDGTGGSRLNVTINHFILRTPPGKGERATSCRRLGAALYEAAAGWHDACPWGFVSLTQGCGSDKESDRRCDKPQQHRKSRDHPQIERRMLGDSLSPLYQTRSSERTIPRTRPNRPVSQVEEQVRCRESAAATAALGRFAESSRLAKRRHRDVKVDPGHRSGNAADPDP